MEWFAILSSSGPCSVSEHWHLRNKLKWMGVGDFNSDDHYSYYCGEEFLGKKWSSPHRQQKFEMHYLGAVSKMTEWPQFISKAYHSALQ